MIQIFTQDKNWKIRKEGLDKVKEVVNSAKFVTNDLGGLPAALSPRTVDTNKILATQVRRISCIYQGIYYLKTWLVVGEGVKNVKRGK